MKPKPLSLELSPEAIALIDELKATAASIAKTAADSARAEVALAEMERLDADLEALTRKRAEHRAAAFLGGHDPDMRALDDEMAAMEQSARAIREDGAAATIALDLLAAQRAELEATQVAIREKLMQLIGQTLIAMRNQDLAHYVDGVDALGKHLAAAAACDVVRRALYPATKEALLGVRMLNKARESDFAIDGDLNVNDHRRVAWWCSHVQSGRQQYADQALALVALLRDAGVDVDEGRINVTYTPPPVPSALERAMQATAAIYGRPA